MGRGRKLLAAAAVIAALALPAGAEAASPDVRSQLVQAVAAEIPGARVSSDSSQEPFVGVPAIADLAAGRAEVMMDPAFWTQIVGNLLVSRTIVLPTPIDLVKPEMYLPTAPVANGPYVSSAALAQVLSRPRDRAGRR